MAFTSALDIPEAATLPACVRDHPPGRMARWIVDGWHVLELAWTASEWAAIPIDDRPLDAQSLGDLVSLLVILGPVGRT